MGRRECPSPARGSPDFVEQPVSGFQLVVLEAGSESLSRSLVVPSGATCSVISNKKVEVRVTRHCWQSRVAPGFLMCAPAFVCFQLTRKHFLFSYLGRKSEKHMLKVFKTW